MNSEITDYNGTQARLLYDAHCAFCRGLVRRFAPLFRQHEITPLPLQTPGIRELLNLTDDELLAEMRLLTRHGAVLAGADALLALANMIWWARPFYWFSWVPGYHSALRVAYARFAKRRYCFGGRCSLATRTNRPLAPWVKWIPAAALPALGWIIGHRLPAWEYMWVLAGGLFFAAKWITLVPLWRSGHLPRFSRMLCYFLLWPGMNAEAFRVKSHVSEPRPAEWLFAVAKTALGAVLLWWVAPALSPESPLLTGWAGMVGIVFLLHFGMFHLLSTVWRTLGIDARPIMRWPVTADSLASFWGSRWNSAFSDLLHGHALKSLARRIGINRAVLVLFGVSGLLHEIVISVPAGGGYGLPTAYFSLQGLALLLERSSVGEKLGIGAGWKGRCWTLLVAGLPSFWLFHPVFVHTVILPMLRAIGAI